MAFTALRENRDYLVIGVMVLAITAGNYVLNGGRRGNWPVVSSYGFTLVHPPGVSPWEIGLDGDNVFDYTGQLRPSSESGMFGYTDEGSEYAVIWATLGEASHEEVLGLHYVAAEVNAVKRDRGITLDLHEVTDGEVNGHAAAYQRHDLVLDMPGMDEHLYADGLVAGWTCDRSGLSFAAYLLLWGTGSPPGVGDAEAARLLGEFVGGVDCH